MSKIVYPVVGSEKRLPFYLTGIGINDPEADVNRTQGLVSHQLLYTTGGNGILEISNKQYHLCPGSILYLSPGIRHHYYPQEKEWKTCWMVFRGSSLSSLMQSLDFLEWECKPVVDIHRMELLFQRILKIASQPVYQGESCSALIYEYILEADRLFHTEQESMIRKGTILEKSLQYMHKNYALDITLEELAGLSDVSLQHFCRVFKKQMGMRPIEYLSHLRIAKAKELLMDTSLSIGEIGIKTGYRDLTYFGWVFKKYEGVSPSQYRKIRDSLL